MKKIVISGATGMLGLSLLEKCIKEDVKVIALVSKNSSRLCRIPGSRLVKVIELNMENYFSYEPAEDEKECDAFVHFAWGHTSREGRNNLEEQMKNLQLTIDALELAKRFGCKKFSFAGSQAQYGDVKGRIRENIKESPIVPYGVAKLLTEQACIKRADELDMIFLGLRIFSIYGPYDMDYTMVSTAVSTYLKHEHMDFSAGTQMWNFLYQDDFADMTFGVIEGAAESGYYNIGHPKSKLLKEYIKEMAEALPGFDYSLAPADESKALLSIEPDMDRTLSLTKSFPKVSFSEGIIKIKEYYEKNISTCTSL